MFIETFQGYNCYSSAIGDFARMKAMNSIQEIILTQWTCFFNMDQFVNGEWYTGAAKGPVDEGLKQDLWHYGNVDVKEYTWDAAKAMERSKEVLAKEGYEILLVDFYYLNSFNWKSLSRFHVTREHDPHFIILEGIHEDGFDIIDPFYHHKETMTLEDFMAARSSKTKQGQLNYNSYEIVSSQISDVDIREMLQERFNRYLEDKMPDEMRHFSKVVRELPEDENRTWAFTAYNCLNQIVYQHQNLMKVGKNYNLNIPNEIMSLNDEWAIIRKEMFEHYSREENKSQDIAVKLLNIADKEENFAEKFLKQL